MENGSSELKVDVVSTKIVNEPTKYVCYTVKIQKNGIESDEHASFIERRYSEFLDLFTKLRQEFPDQVSAFAFPKKAVMGNFSNDTINLRIKAFKSLLNLTLNHEKMVESPPLLEFIQNKEQNETLELIHKSHYGMAVVQLENRFRLLNKLLTDRHPVVLRNLCLLVACCDACRHDRTSHYAKTAVVRFESVSDTDLLRYYVPLLQLCVRTLQDVEVLQERLSSMKRRGVRVDGCLSLLDTVLADFPTPCTLQSTAT